MMTEKVVPLWKKTTLTISEAAELTGIGECKLREVSDDPNCKFVLFIGRKRLLKRKELEEYIERQYSI